jgi:hypothetical protein
MHEFLPELKHDAKQGWRVLQPAVSRATLGGDILNCIRQPKPHHAKYRSQDTCVLVYFIKSRYWVATMRQHR